MKQLHRLAAITVILIAAWAAGPAAAQEHRHGHGHEDGASSVPASSKLELNNGTKWKTDVPLKTGMTAVRNEVQKAVKPIHAGTYSTTDYEALAARIEKRLNEIIAKCKLAPEVDAQFHLVLADLFAGTAMMKKGEKRMDGAVMVIRALGAYAKHFEHPDWKPIEH